MKTKIINTTSDFEKLKDEWCRLFAESGADNIFTSFEWQYHYWKNFGTKNSLFIVTVYDGEKIAAILPLIREKRIGFHELRFISYQVSDYDDILIIQDEAKRTEALYTIFELLAGVRTWDILRLKGIREDSLLCKTINAIAQEKTALSISLEQHCDGAPQIDMTCGWQEYERGLRKSFLSDIRAFRRRAGKNVEFISGEFIDESALGPLISEFSALHRKRRQEAGGNSFFEDDKIGKFFTAVTPELFKKKQLEVNQYKIDGTLAAMEIGFVCNKRFYRYLAAFDSKFKKCSVARLLLYEIIKRCFEKGLRNFDFMLGEEDYKRFWNPVSQKLYFLTITPKTFSGRLSYLILNRFNILTKKLMKKKW